MAGNGDCDAAERWLLIDASRPDEVVLATAQPSATPVIDRKLSFPAAELPTFTDALLRFERETGHRLSRMRCALTIAGAVAGSSFPIARSRWMISISGLAALFNHPVTVINDTAARAWAAIGNPEQLKPYGTRTPADLTTPGRRLLVMIDDGVNGATIDIDSAGVVRVLEMEAGHAGFAPSDETEDRLMAALRPSGKVSWERVLLLPPGAPEWAAAMPGATAALRDAAYARLVGNFVGDLVLSHGAWRGVLLTGRHVPSAADTSAVSQALIGKRQFHRLLMDLPRWEIDQRDHALQGAAALLGRRLAEQRIAGTPAATAA